MGRRKKVISDVQIIDIGDRGASIGKTPTGEIILVQKDVVPGDVADILILGKKKGMKKGVPVNITALSDDRVDPFCQHFGTCGGCKWQNLNYEKQAELKERAVIAAIKRIAKEDPAKVKPIRSAKKIEAYRNKLEYTFSTKRWLTEEEVKSEEKFEDREGLGFHIAGAFDKVLDIEKCHLQDDLTNEIRNKVGELAAQHEWSFYNIRENHGFLRNLMIRNTSNDDWMVTMIFGQEDQDAMDLLFQELIPLFPRVKSWHYIINQKMNSSLADQTAIHHSGDKHIVEQIGGLSYKIGPKSFFQTNSYQAKTLYDAVVEIAELNGDEIVYDLYTGAGSIALYVAQACKEVIGIEIIPEAIEDANENKTLNNVENATFTVGDVKDILTPEFQNTHGVPEVVITDPPRAGMHGDVVDFLIKLGSQKIVYVSCNPSTQARDILLLSEAYNLQQVIPVDMFPHTSHIESVALLTLK